MTTGHGGELDHDALAARRSVRRARAARDRLLRQLLVAGDTVCLAAASVLFLALLEHPHRGLALPLLAVSAGLPLLWLLGLYRARICIVWTAQMLRVTAVALVVSVLIHVSMADASTLRLSIADAAVLAGLVAGLLALFRTWFEAWLRERRRSGDFLRPVVVAGAGPDVDRLAELLTGMPQFGFRVVGLVCPPDGTRGVAGIPWLGGLPDLAELVDTVDATGAILATGGMTGEQTTRAVRTLQRLGARVHLSSGLHGIDHSRIRSVPVAHEPLLYVDDPTPRRRRQTLAKRTVDVGGGVLGLAASAPLMLLAALAIKAEDRGPVLFSQVRVGQDGRCFRMLKLRTMTVDADRERERLAEDNEREGPLFKVADDPRVTRVGRVLRAASLDELPQLLHVIGGSMSLVGPRPALPSEVAHFDPVLRRRMEVPPGLTGLWQLESRDEASFDAYRRLDLFYVDNWSLGLDLTIIALTLPTVILRGLQQARSTSVPASAPAGNEAAEVLSAPRG